MTRDPHFNVIIVDFDSNDIDIEAALHRSDLKRYFYHGLWYSIFKLNPFPRLVAPPWGRRLSSVSVDKLCKWESVTPSGRDTNPSHVNSQQMLVLIYWPRKDRKLNLLLRKRRSHKWPNLNRAKDRTQDLGTRMQRSCKLGQPGRPIIALLVDVIIESVIKSVFKNSQVMVTEFVQACMKL